MITDAYAICTTFVITEFLPYWAIRSWRAISEFLAKIATSMEFEYKSFLTFTLSGHALTAQRVKRFLLVYFAVLMLFFFALSMRVLNQHPKMGFKSPNQCLRTLQASTTAFLQSENSNAQSQTPSFHYFILNANTHVYALSMRFHISKLKSDSIKL